MSEPRTIHIKVMRYNPEHDRESRYDDYHVPYDEQTSLLDALGYIKEKLAPDLSYRWSCRMAVCGSCGVMVDNRPTLACKTFVREYAGKTITVEALSHLPVERDLVVDMTPLMDGIQAVKPYIIGNRRTISDGPNTQTPAQTAKYKQFADCINCGLCYAACPQFGLNPEFIGPAAIALAQRYNLDSRDRGQAERMPPLNSDNGVWCCTFVGYCSEVCPQNVDPAEAIQQGKVASSTDFFFSMLRQSKRGTS